MSTQLPQKFGKYFLLNKIAMGGMAEIYRGKTVGAEGFEREVAIKRILPHFTEDESFVKMFIDEATIAAKLHHANIVQIFDFDMVDESYYIAMEYIEGKDLKRIIEKGIEVNKPLNIFQSVFITIEACKGLHYAHTKKHKNKPINIIHRDISPHNVMVSFNGEVKLMDFGIAKAASRSTKTRAGTVKGKCAYMSPEQARGKNLDPRSDLFAMGILLWELVTYRRLFLGDSDFETLSNVLKADVPPPSKFNPQIPKELEAVIFKALSKDREERYASVAHFLKELNQFFYSHVVDIDSISLSTFMQDLFSDDIRALSEMQAAERTNFVDLADVPTDEQSQREVSKPQRRGTIRRPSQSHMPANDPAPLSRDQRTAIAPEHMLDSAASDLPPTVALTPEQVAAAEFPVSDKTVPMSGVAEYMEKMGISPPGEEQQATLALSAEQLGAPIARSQPELRRTGSGASPLGPELRPVGSQQQQQTPYPARNLVATPSVSQLPDVQSADQGVPKRSFGLFLLIFLIVAGLVGGAVWYFGFRDSGDDDGKNGKEDPPKTLPKVSLTIKTQPIDANVTVGNQKLKGTSPFQIEVEKGKDLVIKVRAAGYLSERRSITAKRSLSLTITLQPTASLPAMLTIKTTPGADVQINGTFAKNDNGVVLHKGWQKQKIKISISKDGHFSRSHELTLLQPAIALELPLVKFLGTVIVEYPHDRRRVKLRINGHSYGHKPSPITLSELTLNQELKIKCSKRGFPDYEKTIKVTGNGIVVKIPVFQEAPPQVDKSVSFTLTVIPADARVFFNGKLLVGTGTYTVPGLELGQVATIIATKADYTPYVTRLKLEQKTYNVTATLQAKAKLATVVIDSTPAGYIEFNGAVIGRTPQSMNLKGGTYTFVIKTRKGSKRLTLTVVPGESYSRMVRF